MRAGYRGRSFFNFTGFDEPQSRDTDPNMLFRFLKNLGRNVKATGVYFLIGIFLSALFQRYVPAEAMVSLFGGDEAFGVDVYKRQAYSRRAPLACADRPAANWPAMVPMRKIPPKTDGAT